MNQKWPTTSEGDIEGGKSPSVPKEFEQVRRFIDLISSSDQWVEITDEGDSEGDYPVVVNKTVSDDYVISVAATPNKPESSSGFGDGSTSQWISTEEVLSVVESAEGPAITSKEVAEATSCTEMAARDRLCQLYQEGRVNKKESGEATIWWESDPDQNLLQGFGALSDTEIPQRMKEVRQELREEWTLPSPDKDLLDGFGALRDSNVPQRMKEEREDLREDW